MTRTATIRTARTNTGNGGSVVDADRRARAGARTVLARVDELVAERRLDEAAQLAAATLAERRLPPVAAARLRLTLSSILFVIGNSGAAVATAEAALAQPDLPSELYAGGETARLLGMLAREDFRQARGPAEAILAGGDRPGLDGALSGALTALAFIAWHDGRVVDAVSLLRAAVVRADYGPGEARRINPRLALAAALTALGDFGAAEALLDAGEREIRQSGDSMWADVPAIYRARLHLAAGRLDDAAVDARAGLIAAEGHGTRFFAPLALTTLASVALLRGDLKEASRQVSACRAAPPPPLAGFGSGAFNWIEARVADAQAGPGPAVDVLSDVYGDPVAHKRLLVEEPASAPWLVRVALAIGDRDRADVIAGYVERLAAENAGVGSVTASANHARGLLARDPLALREAAAGHQHPWARGSAFEDGGLVELDAGDRSGARAALDEAVECYELAGATRDASRVRGRVRHIASRRSRAASRPVCGWGSLTDAERRVANVVSEGLTNPEVAARMYLSRYTVDFHLRQIFRKLGIRSRVELTRLVLTRTAGSV